MSRIKLKRFREQKCKEKSVLFQTSAMKNGRRGENGARLFKNHLAYTTHASNLWKKGDHPFQGEEDAMVGT